MRGLDYSLGMPNIETMKQNNIVFVCRYVGWSDLSQTKILTPAEAKLLSQNDIAIVSNYEWYGSRPQEGAAAATVDAARAASIHKSCGGPDITPIYFSVDYDSPGSDVANYFKELGKKLGLQRVGAYGGYRCIKYLFDNGLIAWGWQTYAWSNGQWDSRAHIRQTQNSVQFGGIEVDFDTGMFEQIGQWKAGGTPVTTTTKVILNPQMCVAETPYWFQLSENEMNTCGPTSAAMIAKSVKPNTPLTVTAEDIDVLTDAIIKDVFQISDPKQFPGVDTWDHDMTDIMTYLVKKLGNVHFQVVSTMEQLEAGIRAGYLGLYGCNERDLFMWDGTFGWKPPYSWQLSAGHILGLVGLDNNGNWITADPLNNAVHVPIYRRSSIANTFSGGMIVQITDWLEPIPDIHNWPVGFNAQKLGDTVPTPPASNLNMRTAFETEVTALHGTTLDLKTGIMNDVWELYQQGKFLGPALTGEIQGKTWNGTPMVFQVFAGGRVEWVNGNATLYTWTGV